MKLFLYYASHSLINTIKKLMKTWVSVILIMFVVFALIGGIASFFTNDDDKEDTSEPSETTISQVVEDETESVTDEIAEEDTMINITVKNGFFSEMMKRFGVTTANIVDIAISAIFLIVLATNVINSKSSGKIFLPADVPMLFATPMKPQTVLMFRLTCTLGTSLFISIFMIFQIPNLIHNLGLSIWGAVSIIVVYMMILVISTLIQVAFYTITSKLKNGAANINIFMIGFYGLIGLGFVAYMTISKLDVPTALFNYFASPSTHWIPFWGWLRGISYNAINGNTSMSVIYLGLFIVSCILIMIFIWKMKADFYEDAMFATERKAEQIDNARRASSGATIIRNKERKASLDRTGFHFGNGANVFFFKAVFNRFRFAKLKIFSGTMIIYTLVAGVISYIARSSNMNDPFWIPTAALGIMAFYRTLGDPIREDTSREFFILIPERPYTKILYSLLGCLTVSAIDLIIPMIVAAVMLGTNPLTVIVWFLFILSVSFFATTVGTFISLSVPGDSGSQIKVFVQIMFLYFGMGPSAVVIILGIVLNALPVALAIGVIMNATTGFLVSLLLPLFLGRK